MCKAVTPSIDPMTKSLKGLFSGQAVAHPLLRRNPPKPVEGCVPAAKRSVHKRIPQASKRRVRFSEDHDMAVNINVCEILRPASDMSQSERQVRWYQRDEFVKCLMGFVETMKACKRCELTTPTSYASVLRVVYDECCKVVDDSAICVPQSLATLVAFSASVYDLRGLERNIEKTCGSLRKSHMKKRIGIIVSMNKVLSQMAFPYEVRALQLRVLSETLSRPGRVFGRVIGLADAQSALEEYANKETDNAAGESSTAQTTILTA